MIILPMIRSSNQGKALLLGYFAFSVAYLGSAWLSFSVPQMLEQGQIEAAIPFVNWSIWVYLTQFLLLPFAIVLARDDHDRSLAYYAMLVSTVSAAIIFIGWPTEIERQVQQLSGLTGHAWAILYSTDTPRNCFPSLHVALATVAGITLWRGKYRVAAWLWPILIVISTLTTKQHIVWDVAGGLVLAFVAWILTEKLFSYACEKSSYHSANP